MEDISLDDFTQVDESITTKMLDDEVSKLRELKKDYELAKRESDLRHGAYEDQRNYLVSLLAKAGKSKYEAEGIGTIHIVSKLKVKFPSILENKMAFYEHIKGLYGEEGLANLMTVNYNTLNAFYNEEFERAISNGTSPDEFTLPGIESPEESKTLSFRQSK